MATPRAAADDAVNPIGISQAGITTSIRVAAAVANAGKNGAGADANTDDVIDDDSNVTMHGGVRYMVYAIWYMVREVYGSLVPAAT